MFGFFKLDKPVNEPIRDYRPGTPETASLRERLARMRANPIEIPLVIGGREVRTGDLGKVVCPHDHRTVLATYHKAGPAEVRAALDAAASARADWERLPWADRAAIFLKAADMVANECRDAFNAATMLGQSKNVYQAEIDAACESIDFLRFNVWNMTRIYAEQPDSDATVWNRMEYRPLDGFVFAVTPFNFTAIGVNLVSSPAVAGNTVLWKPAGTQVLSAWYTMRLFELAGLPGGVINFIPGSGAQVGNAVIADPRLAGIHFTGSTGVFNEMWRRVGESIGAYRNYPRLVGETGGKDFIFAHPSAEPAELAVALGRGAFEYQGQKCSAASRAYIPASLWPGVKDRLFADLAKIKTGDVEDFTTFMGAVIDRASFDNIRGYLDGIRASPDAEILFGGGADDSTGWFVEPTVVLARTPHFRTMHEEIFGPVLTVHVYDDAKFAETLDLCDATSPYALTGSIFARDRAAVVAAFERLRHSAGNFYINDKCTGAVVGRQPFGGARKSGTNDKAGAHLNLLRWVSARTIKETYRPAREIEYPYMTDWRNARERQL